MRPGSSPLTRGKRVPRARFGSQVGLIPAHAGKTGPPGTLTCRPRAHPRSRGENNALLLNLHQDPGSSPLTRGKRGYRDDRGAHPRLIPAHAGKTAGPRREPRIDWAHPRSRGENEDVHGFEASRTGSSPLTRGKRQILRDRIEPHRLIPAHAGKTRDGVLRSMSIGAHPRSRGENYRLASSVRTSRGSSPLTRGKHLFTLHTERPERLIPAHAGKTDPLTASPSRLTAHPRSRGENHEALESAWKEYGSSPLTRGKPSFDTRFVVSGGLIPAHAGKTRLPHATPGLLAAHPRSRGEN